MEKWIMRFKNGHLPSQLNWLAYRLQLWPGLRYGLGTLVNDVEEIEDLFSKLDYALLPVLGIVRTVKKGWRRLLTTFSDFGLRSLPTEQLISRLNLFIQHWQTGSSLSNKLSISMHYLQLQLGTNNCPFKLPYNDWHFLSWRCWLKMLWRTVQMAKLDLFVAYQVVPLPWEKDILLMELFKSEGCSPDLLLRLNRVRLSLNALFLSDIATADGCYLKAFATEQGSGGVKSAYNFPPEWLTPEDWKQWLLFWATRTESNFKLIRPLGDWKNATHRDWEWFLAADHLQRREEQGVCHYSPTNLQRTTRSRTVFTQSWSDPTATKVSGQPVSVIL